MHRTWTRRGGGCALLAGLFLFAAVPAVSAQEVLFEDDFSTLDPTFGEGNESLNVKDNTLFMTPDANMWWRYFYESVVFENADITLKVKLANPSQKKGTGAGIMFWGVGYEDYWLFEISDYETISVRHFTPGGRQLYPVNWQNNDALKTGTNEWNELRVRIVGNRATIFLNGKELFTLRGKAPDGGSLIGLFAETGEVKDTSTFAALKVTEPEVTGEEEEASDPNVLFEDDFATLDPSFGGASEGFGVEGNELYMRLEPNQWWRYLYQSTTFDDADITAKVKLQDLTAEQGGGAGVMFWATAMDNMYLFEISDSGTFAVRRFMPNRFLYPVIWQQSDAIKTEGDAWNELRIVTLGRRATFYINGQEVATIKGRPPEGGGLIGFFTETGEGGSDEGRFSALKVVVPENTGGAPDVDDPNVILADDFETLDPAWGSESGSFGVKDGKLFIKPDPGYTWTRFYEGDVVVGDMDATIKLHIDGSDQDYSVGSFMFWAKGGDDYWAYMVFDDGSVGVGHWLKTRWLWPIRTKAIPAEANFDKNGFTEIGVKTEGKKATFTMNGTTIGTVSGMPPEDGFYIGMFNEAGDQGATIEYDDLMIKKP